MQVRRNELGTKAVCPSSNVMSGAKAAFVGQFIEDNRQQRAATILRDVAYVIDAHIEIVTEVPGINNIAKHLEMFKRRASQGQCFHAPCLGNREFPAMFELVEQGTALPLSELPESQKNRFFGLMLHDMVYRDDKKGQIICAHTGKKQTAEARFFMAELVDGVLHVPTIQSTLA